jgi:DNA-binding MarR family transcriptional regulator
MKDEPPPVLYTETISMFLSVYRHLRRCSRRMHAEGIGGRKVATLRHLRDVGPLTVGQIRDYLYVSVSSASELVARLQEKGYVQRTRSRQDNRVVVVSLTEEGKRVADGVPLDGIPLLRERLKHLPPERLAAIRDAMADISQILELADDH